MRGTLAPLIKLGVFVVITVVTTGILGLTIANTDLKESKDYTARFTDVTGVFPGDDVRMSGVKVGQVTGVNIVERRLADVHFTVESDRRIPKSVSAKLRYRNLIGQRYLSLDVGNGGGSGGILQAGDTIPLSQTTPALNLTVLFNGFKPLFQALDPDEVNKLSFKIIKVLQGESGTVNDVLRHTATVTKTIADKDKVIGEVINNLNTVLDTANRRTPELNDVLIRTQQLVTGLAEQRKPIGNAVAALDRLSNTTSDLVAEGREPLKQSIEGLGRLTKNLDKHEPDVEHFVKHLPGKLARLTRTASYGSWFNFYMCGLQGKVGISSLDVLVPLTPLPASEMPERCRS